MIILGIIIACALAAWGWHWLMTRNATPNDAMAVGFGVLGGWAVIAVVGIVAIIWQIVVEVAAWLN